MTDIPWEVPNEVTDPLAYVEQPASEFDESEELDRMLYNEQEGENNGA